MNKPLKIFSLCKRRMVDHGRKNDLLLSITIWISQYHISLLLLGYLSVRVSYKRFVPAKNHYERIVLVYPEI